jgi:hypothetical protein
MDLVAGAGRLMSTNAIDGSKAPAKKYNHGDCDEVEAVISK